MTMSPIGGCGIPGGRASLPGCVDGERAPGARSTPCCRQPALPAPLVQLDGWILLYQQLGSPLSARKPCSHVCLPLDISQRGREKQFTANVPFISQQMLLELLLHVKDGACPARLGSLHRTRGARVNTPAPPSSRDQNTWGLQNRHPMKGKARHRNITAVEAAPPGACWSPGAG